MIQFAHVALVIVIVVVLLMYLAKNPVCSIGNPTEEFDTYYNTDMGAHAVYESGQFGGDENITVDEAALKAKYEWNTRDRNGDKVYDVFYRRVNREKNKTYDDEHHSMNASEPYDTAFSTSTADKGYKIDDIYEESVSSNFKGQSIYGAPEVYLSQKGLH